MGEFYLHPMKHRACGMCKNNPALNRKGKPRCAECKGHVAEAARKHRNAYNSVRLAVAPRIDRVCRDCRKEFTDKQGVLCWKCKDNRYCANHHQCGSCPKMIRKGSLHCYQCAPKKRKKASGGRIVANGYVLRHIPEHPNANAGYVPEHRAVMEEMIGRYLSPEETVHHLNGVRDDNRPKNLELWASKHPAGQRANDLVDYALEVLALYAPGLLGSSTVSIQISVSGDVAGT